MMKEKESNGPAAVYEHDHPPVKNINVLHEESMSVGQKIADKVAAVVGSWTFIVAQSVILVIWLTANVYLVIRIHNQPGFLKAWDPYPFILLNLVLSFQAAYTGPVVMMSQNRQTDKDRLMAQNDFEINQKAEREIEVILNHLRYQDRMLSSTAKRLEANDARDAIQEIEKKLDALMSRLDRTREEAPEIGEKI